MSIRSKTPTKPTISTKGLLLLDTPNSLPGEQWEDHQLSCKLGAMRSPIWPAPPLMTKRCLTVFLCRRGWGWMSDRDCWCVMLTLPISFKCNHSKIYCEINNSEVIRERIHAGQRCFDYQCVLLRLTRGDVGGGLIVPSVKVNYTIVVTYPNIRSLCNKA